MYNEKITFTNLNRMTSVAPQTTVKCGPICRIHFHPEFEFLYVNSGTMKYYADDAAYIAHKGDVMFINSNVPHYTEALTDNCSHSFVRFNEPRMENNSARYLTRFLKLSNNTSAYLFTVGDEDNVNLTNYINEIIDNYDNEEVHCDYHINAMMYSILALLYRRKILESAESKINTDILNRISPVLNYIHLNYSEELTLEKLSKILNISEQHFCRLFKKATGSNVSNYINFIRIYNAEKMLKTNMNISEIAENTGFSSLSYFNKIFKKYKQYPPSKYRTLSKQKEGLLNNKHNK